MIWCHRSHGQIGNCVAVAGQMGIRSTYYSFETILSPLLLINTNSISAAPGVFEGAEFSRKISVPQARHKATHNRIHHSPERDLVTDDAIRYLPDPSRIIEVARSESLYILRDQVLPGTLLRIKSSRCVSANLVWCLPDDVSVMASNETISCLRSPPRWPARSRSCCRSSCRAAEECSAHRSVALRIAPECRPAHLRIKTPNGYIQGSRCITQECFGKLLLTWGAKSAPTVDRLQPAQ